MHALSWAEKEGIKPPKLNNSNSGAASNSSSPSSSTTSVVLADQAAVNMMGAAGTALDSENQEGDRISKDELSKELLVLLLDVIEIIRDCTYNTMSESLVGPVPINLLNNLIAISGSKSSYCTEISTMFFNLISGQDKEVISVEWKKNLSVNGEENFTPSSFPVELHTLSVIGGHLTEISKYSNFSILLSLKHTLKSLIYLVYYLLPICKQDEKNLEKLKEILVPMLFDIRTEYIYDITKKRESYYN